MGYDRRKRSKIKRQRTNTHTYAPRDSWVCELFAHRVIKLDVNKSIHCFCHAVSALFLFLLNSYLWLSVVWLHCTFFPRRLLLRCDIIWELSRCSPFRCWYYYYFFSASFALIKQKHTLKITELTENSCESVTLRLCVSAARECIGGRVFSFIAHDYFDYYF